MSDHTRRTAAVVVASLGAALLIAAASVFIAIRWDQLALAGKVGVVGAVSLAALGVGHRMRSTLPGVASVLTHLGALLVPLDVGGAMVAAGSGRAATSLVAGLSGLVVLEVFDRSRSPILVAARGASLAGAAIGAAALLGPPPSLFLIATASAAVLLRRQSDGMWLAAFAASSPVVVLTAEAIAREGSLLAWLADVTRMPDAATVAIAVAAIVITVASGNRTARWISAIGIAFVNTPATVGLIADNPDATLVLLAASTVAVRLFELLFDRRDLGFHFDLWTWLASLGSIGFILADWFPGRAVDPSGIAAGLLIITSWLVADAAGRDGLGRSAWRRILHGTVGSASTYGVLFGVVTSMIAVNRNVPAAAFALVFAMAVAGSERTKRTIFMFIGLTLTTLVLVAVPWWLPLSGVLIITLSHTRAIADLRNGGSPDHAATSQIAGFALAAFGVLVHAAETDPSWWAPLLLITASAVVAVAASRATLIPDLDALPRWFILLPVLASSADPTMWGALALGVGVLFVVDSVVHRLPIFEHVGVAHVVAGSWILALDLELVVREAYLAGPSLALAWYGARAVRRGKSSWLGLAPAVGLFAVGGLAERLDGGPGWHTVGTGVLAIVALIVGVDRRWAGPAAIGTLALISTVGVESAAFVPQVPLWIWLAVGGITLVGAGAILERRVVDEGAASLRTTWAGFR